MRGSPGTAGRRPTGVCVLRAEPTGLGSLVITLRMSLDVEEATSPVIRHYADPDAATQAVRDFLTRCGQVGG